MKKYIQSAMEYLSGRSRTTLILMECLIVALVGYLDYVTGVEVSFTLFYLIPVSFSSWLSGKWAGILMSIICSIMWLFVDLSSGHVYSHPLIGLWNMTLMFGFFFIVSYSLSALRSSLDRETALARVDALTGVVNRRHFFDLASLEVRRASRYAHPITLIMIDIDNFKAVNDRHGHAEGDRLLRAVGGVMRDNLRGTDVVARLGGDEFAVMLVEAGAEAGRIIPGKLRHSLLAAMRTGGWSVTFSIGAATFAVPPVSVDDMIKAADDLMYTAKRNGKDTVEHRTVTAPVVAA